MTRMNQRIAICATSLAALLTVTNTTAAGPPEDASKQTANPRTAEEIVPGLPLDGSVIIDESLWLSLIGEPGRHMTEAFELFTNDNLPDAAKSIRTAASFLYIASDNALEGPNVMVQKAAVALDELHRRVAKDEVKSGDELKSVFSRAHLAMSRHHAAKAAGSITKKKWALAGNYLSSSANHLQRASYWSGNELRADTKRTLTDAKQTAGRLVEDGGKSVEKAGKLIETLGKRIERLGKSLAEPARDDSDPK